MLPSCVADCLKPALAVLMGQRVCTPLPPSTHVDVKALNMVSPGPKEEALAQLASNLEALDEAQSAVDRSILAELVVRHEKTARKPASRISENGPTIDAALFESYKQFPLPDSAQRPFLDGTTPSLLVEHLQQNSLVPLHPCFLKGLLSLTTDLLKTRM